MKKIIITEEQLKMVVNTLIVEQDDDRTFNRVVQCFLNKIFKTNLKIDGLIGDKTKELVSRYQSSKGMYPVDGIFGGDTRSKMTPEEKKIWKSCVREQGDFIDRIVGI